MSLDKYRKSIDEIDEKLLELYEKRMSVVLDVAKYKKQHNLPILNSNRENEVIEKQLSNLKNKDISPEVISLFGKIMSLSKDYEHRIMSKPKFDTAKNYVSDNSKIGYYGCEGSYTHVAANNFNSSSYKIGFSKFNDAFGALYQNVVDYIVLPIENSSTGGIHDIYDGLLKFNAKICGETYVKVDHNLIGIEDINICDITEVFSHSQGFFQCSNFLDNYKNLKLTTYNSTGESVAYVKQLNDKKKCAIGSALSAELNNLHIISKNINNIQNNYTRFILIGKNIMQNYNFDKISVIFYLKHETGSLYNSLSYFHKNNINLVKIESRPNLLKPFEYNFYIDFIGNLEDTNIKNLFKDIESKNISYNILGLYKRGLI